MYAVANLCSSPEPNVLNSSSVPLSPWFDEVVCLCSNWWVVARQCIVQHARQVSPVDGGMNQITTLMRGSGLKGGRSLTQWLLITIGEEEL